MAELERQLRECGRRLDETQELACVGSWEWTIDEDEGWRSVWSAQMSKIFGRDPGGPAPPVEELLAAVHPDDLAEFEGLVEHVRTVAGPFEFAYRIVDGEGEVRHLKARGTVVEAAPGRLRHAYGTTQDISDLRRSQAQLEHAQRLESIGHLAGAVAHDFNNLLSIVLNNAESLIDEVEDEATGRGLAEIERAARSAAELTRRLLLFSRRDAPESKDVDLAAAVSDAEAMLRRTLGEHIELTVEAPDDLPPVKLDTCHVEQLLLNLAVNARDALPSGGRIAVSARRLDAVPAATGFDAKTPHVLLRVVDDGSGMTEEVAKRAFEPFFTTKPRGEGTGLGLATVHGIVERAGGRIEVESEPGRGTSVGIYLPAAAPAARASGGGPSPTRAAGKTVLVVDNEEPVRTIVSNMLEKHGYETRVAESGSAAEEILTAEETEAVDLLLTDVRMPRMSGRDLVARLRERGMTLPAVYMSGYGDDSPPFGPLDGGVAILEKPFTREQLLRVVGEALDAG